MFSYKANAICMAGMTMPAGAGVAASHCWNRVRKPGQLINYARFWSHRWTFAKNRTAHAQTHYRKSTQWQWASFVSESFSTAAHTDLVDCIHGLGRVHWQKCSLANQHRVHLLLHLRLWCRLCAWSAKGLWRDFNVSKDFYISFNFHFIRIQMKYMMHSHKTGHKWHFG